MCIVAGFLLWGCAPKRVVFTSDPSFPPKGKQPMKVFLAAPVDTMDLSPVRDEMIRSTGDADQALAKARCVWGKGLAELTLRNSKNTELVSGVLGDTSLYPPTTEWIQYAADALSTPDFSVTHPAAISRFQADGFDYIVVPQNLSLRSDVGTGTDFEGLRSSFVPLREELYLDTPVAVVDVKKSAIVWTGVVSSYRYNLSVQSSGAMEREAYDWLHDLLVALGRKVRQPTTRFAPCR
jgi:hypothetical protein